MIYFSKSTNLMQEEGLSNLLQQSRDFNLKHEITGMLIYVQGRFLNKLEGRFMQVLEGSEAVVEELFAKIQKDSRHHQLMVLQRAPLEKRNFSNWQMGFETLTMSNDQIKGFLNWMMDS